MATLRSANHNDAITRLPVLMPARQGKGEGWVCGFFSREVHGQRLRLPQRHPVRMVPASALEQFADPKTRAAFETAYGRVPADFRAQLLTMLGIVGAVQENDLRKVAMLTKRARPTEGLAASLDKMSAVMLPWNMVAATVNTGLWRNPPAIPVMPVLWQRGSQLVPALLCGTPAQALFAHALFRVAGKHGMGVCQKCGNLFFATRTEQSYCNYKCQTAAAMKRYRQNLKAKESKGGKRARRVKR